MVTEKLTGEDLLTLQNARGNICVSVIVPTHRTSPDRRADKLEVEKAIDKAKQLLQYKYPQQQITPLEDTMDELFGEIDFMHNTEGIGLYVSNNVKLSVRFPFEVTEKIMAEDNFEIRDLLYKINYAVPYYALMLTEKGGRLYVGSWNDLSEIKDSKWPVKYEDDYAYAKPARSSSFAGHSHVKMYEKDKSELTAIRFKSFFHQLDKELESYLISDIPLVLLGPEKELAWFEEVSRHKKSIIKKIHGSYNHSNPKSLSDLVWPAMFEHQQKERKQLIKEFEEKIGALQGISGIQEVWQAAKEGKAFKLLIEKDYRCPGFLTAEDYRLYMRPPAGPHKILPDAVDELIETVIEKDGKVYFTDNDLLKDYGRVVLITRY